MTRSNDQHERLEHPNVLRLRRLGIDTHQEPVVYMAADCAVCRSEGWAAQARVAVSLNGRSVIATLNVVTASLLADDEASLSDAAWNMLDAAEGDHVALSHPSPVTSLALVRRKLYGHRLRAEDFPPIIGDIAAGRYSAIELAAYVAACTGGRLDLAETVALTRAMVGVGDRLTCRRRRRRRRDVQYHSAPFKSHRLDGGSRSRRKQSAASPAHRRNSTMIRSILVPLDGSEFAARALPLAISIAQSTGAKLELVHVHDRPVQLLGAPPNDLRFDVEMEQLMGRELAQTAERLHADTRLPIEAALLEGPVVESILQRVEATHPWLVVMTSHRQGGLRRMVTGSVADALARKAGVPVLIERGTGDAPPPKHGSGGPLFANILLPLDGSRPADDIVEYAAQLGEPRRTTFTLLRIVVPIPMFVMPAPTPPMPDDDSAVERSRSEALAQFDRVAYTLKQLGFLVMPHVVVHSQPAAAILAFAEEHPTDLIALSTHGHGGFARAILGSVADKVMRGADVPILLHTSPSTALEEEFGSP